jgi:probable F420-dependent oxidoreductase
MTVARPLGVVLRDLLPSACSRSLLPPGALLELATAADRLGYDSVWFPEGSGRELLGMLGAAAVLTARVRLGTGILPIHSRPPAVAAMGAATLADLTGGRFILGLGVGHRRLVEAGYGRRYRRPVDAMREYVAIVRAALAGRTVAFPGRVFRVEAFRLEAVPRHPVAVYVAALGERMLRLAGEVADGVILNWATPAWVRRAADVVRDAAARAGRHPDDVRVVCYVRAAVTSRASEAWGVVRRLLATYAAMPAYARALGAAGFGAEVARIGAAWQTGGPDAAARAVPDTLLAQMAVVGSAGRAREGLEAYHDAGADLVAAYPFPVGDDGAAAMRATIEGLADSG